MLRMAGCHDPDPQGLRHVFLDSPGSLTPSGDYRVDPAGVSPSNLVPAGPE